jgi:hypothetical protein
MKAHLISGLLFAAVAGLGAAGCVFDTAPQAEDDSIAAQSDALMIGEGRFYTVRPDLRRCMAPLCGGYFIKEVNSRAPERYVSSLDFSASGIDPRTIAQVQQTPAHDLLLRGWLGEKDARFHTRALMVADAYRGLPGIEVAAGDAFYRVNDRYPPIMCFVAPCNNLVIHRLNSAEREMVTSLEVERALATNVDATWVADRVRYHGAIVAGHVRDGIDYPGGPEQVIDASQVWIHLPALTACPPRPHPLCETPLVATYDRTPDRCMVFTGCDVRYRCPMFVPPRCEPGYHLALWATNDTACVDTACDPDFLVH